MRRLSATSRKARGDAETKVDTLEPMKNIEHAEKRSAVPRLRDHHCLDRKESPHGRGEQVLMM